MSKVSVVVEDDPSIAVSTRCFTTSFKASYPVFQVRTIPNKAQGNYYIALHRDEIDELIELLRTVKRKLVTPQSKEGE